jgi:ADP-ribosylglycohydrolase
LGRDCDSTATTVGAWVGALHGESGLPKEWVDPVCEVNTPEIDIRGLATQLIELAIVDLAFQEKRAVPTG